MQLNTRLPASRMQARVGISRSPADAASLLAVVFKIKTGFKHYRHEPP
jgi:hypothetical protein